MLTLFKRSNGIFYIVTDGKDGRRRWISTGERTRAKAVEKLSTINNRSKPSTNSKRLSVFFRELTSAITSFYAPETLGIYKRSLASFLAALGDQQIASINAQHIDIFKQRRIHEVCPTPTGVESLT